MPLSITSGNLKDGINKALIVVPAVHHEVHEGETWQAGVSDLSLANGATVALILVAGANKELHAIFAIACGGDAEVEITRGVTIDVAGGGLIEMNMKESALDANEGIAQSNPTTSGGMPFPTRFCAGGTGGNAAGGALREGTEFIIARNSNLLVELTNRSGQAKVASITAQWYEEDPA